RLDPTLGSIHEVSKHITRETSLCLGSSSGSCFVNYRVKPLGSAAVEQIFTRSQLVALSKDAALSRSVPIPLLQVGQRHLLTLLPNQDIYSLSVGPFKSHNHTLGFSSQPSITCPKL